MSDICFKDAKCTETGQWTLNKPKGLLRFNCFWIDIVMWHGLNDYEVYVVMWLNLTGLMRMHNEELLYNLCLDLNAEVKGGSMSLH